MASHGGDILQSFTIPSMCKRCKDVLRESGSSRDLSAWRYSLTSACPLCYLIVSAIRFANTLNTDPLRSYSLRFLEPVYHYDISAFSPAPHTTFQLDPVNHTIKCSPRDYYLAESYTEVIRQFPHREDPDPRKRFQYEDTVDARRNIEFLCRLPRPTEFDSSVHQLDLRQANSSFIISHISSLLEDCRTNHSSCQRAISDITIKEPSESFPYPIRLIHATRSALGIDMRLVTVRKTVPTYATLSHRWHGNQQYKTTKSNIANSFTNITFAKLPRTFQDAVVFTVEMGMEYLWIDSICIIQDDMKDWQEQSGQIGSIFGGSTCTYAAIDAFAETGKDMGLFLSRNVSPASVMISSLFKTQYNGTVEENHPSSTTEASAFEKNDLDMQRLSLEAWDSSTFTLANKATSFEMSVEHSPWNIRGWIFQERLLSTRILYFTKEQIFWECAEGIQCEPGLKRYDTSKLGLGYTANHSLHRIFRLRSGFRHQPILRSDSENQPVYFDTWKEYYQLREWWLIVKRYSECDLTFTRDRWAAIKGLCDTLRSYYSSEIYAGIWKTGAGACLLWHARTSPLKSLSDFVAPSWSWLSLEGPIAYAYEDESYTGYVQRVYPLVSECSFNSITSVDMRGTKSTTTVYGFSGSLTLTCPLSTATISQTKFQDLHFRELTGQVTDLPASEFFHQASAGKSQLELSREYSSVDLPDFTRFLIATDDNKPNHMSQANQFSEVGRAIGWIVLDCEVLPVGPVLCAGVVMRKLFGAKTTEQTIIDCIVLAKYPSVAKDGVDCVEFTYRRIGRGRIVEHEWLSCCNVESIQIV